LDLGLDLGLEESSLDLDLGLLYYSGFSEVGIGLGLSGLCYWSGPKNCGFGLCLR